MQNDSKWHDEARERQLVRLFETVVNDFRMNLSTFPKLSGTYTMQFPFWKFIGKFYKSRPQLTNTF